MKKRIKNTMTLSLFMFLTLSSSSYSWSIDPAINCVVELMTLEENLTNGVIVDVFGSILSFPRDDSSTPSTNTEQAVDAHPDTPYFAEYISFPSREGDIIYAKIITTNLQPDGIVEFYIEFLDGKELVIIFSDLSLVKASEEAKQAFERRK